LSAETAARQHRLIAATLALVADVTALAAEARKGSMADGDLRAP